jgi:hypothetical protein
MVAGRNYACGVERVGAGSNLLRTRERSHPRRSFILLRPSRRALVIAASFALGLSAVGSTAQAGLLGSDDSAAVEGVGLPVAGDLLGGGLLGILGGESGLLGGILGGEAGLLGGILGGGGLPVVGALGGEGGLPVVGDVLGDGGGLPVVGDVLGGGGGLPLVGDVLGGEMLDVVTLSGLLGSL